MRFEIQCGEYGISLDRPSAFIAALDAIGLWKCRTKKPPLAKLVSIKDEQDKVSYMFISSLIEAHGLEIDNAAHHKHGEDHRPKVAKPL